MNNLIRKDLADLGETQLREHAQILVVLSRYEELKTQARKHAQVRETQFFTPVDESQPNLNVIQIPILLNPPSLQHSGPPPPPT